MKVRTLGTAAGGGLPQWNCGCLNCSAVRAGDPAFQPRTQSSIAVSATGECWVLFNASPDIRFQIEAFSPFHPRGDIRSSPFSAVFLTDAEVDHTAGLLLLREGREIALSSTRFVREALIGNGLLSTLGCYLEVRWTEVVPGVTFELRDSRGMAMGLEVEAFEVAGDPPLYYRGDGRPISATTVGARVRTPGARAALVYVPGAGGADAGVLGRIGAADVLLWDGTFWADDELVQLGISDRTATAMGHLPISGPGGSLERFRGLSAARKVYVHINNTNPILREDSTERGAVEAAGWEVAVDGMEIKI